MQDSIGSRLRFARESKGLTISGAGHMLPIESPKSTLDAIKTFILKTSS